MKSVPILTCLLALFALGACKKPVLEVTDKTIPPLVLSTPISDSLPAAVVKALQLEDVNGVKIKYHSGLYTSYFEYDAERNLLLQTISELPFSLHATIADTRCQPVPSRVLEQTKQEISITEYEHTTFFWDVDQSDVEVFECVKPPYRHIMQIAKNSNRILHRIEFLG